MVVGQLGLNRIARQPVESVIVFDKGKYKWKKEEKEKSMFLEIVPIQHHNMVVHFVLVQELIQFYVTFQMSHVQVK